MIRKPGVKEGIEEMTDMIKAGIVGGTGYTGVELLRILVRHPEVEIVVVTSRADAGKRVDEVYPSLSGWCSVVFTEPDVDTLSGCDVVFFATPNGTAMQMAQPLLQAGVRIIDLSADFRIQDTQLWSKWYGMEHICPDLVSEAVYGLPEIYRDVIPAARLVACPGCYPTAVQLPLIPLLQQDLLDTGQIIADVKSGVSGAGRKAQLNTLMSEAGESFKAYGASGHRHFPEIHQGLSLHTDQKVNLVFVPHLLPMIRGIHASLYVRLKGSLEQVQSVLMQYYQNEVFVNVMNVGEHPDTRNVKGSNHCHIAVHQQAGSDTLIILSVIDNLVKGAAGQAVQNMNLMFGFAEDQALDVVPLYP